MSGMSAAGESPLLLIPCFFFNVVLSCLNHPPKNGALEPAEECMYAELCHLNALWFAAPLRSSSFPLSYAGTNTVHMQKLYNQIKDFTSCESQIKNQTILTYRSHPLLQGSEEQFVLAREVRPPKMCQNHPEMKLPCSSREGPLHVTGSAP